MIFGEDSGSELGAHRGAACARWTAPSVRPDVIYGRDNGQFVFGLPLEGQYWNCLPHLPVSQIIAAFELPENKDKGVVLVDGRMVERTYAETAQRTVAIADAIGAMRD